MTWISVPHFLEKFKKDILVQEAGSIIDSKAQCLMMMHSVFGTENKWL